MKKEIKVGQNTFEFDIPSFIDKSTSDILTEWNNVATKQENSIDTWSTIPLFPQYKFKNLKFKSGTDKILDEKLEQSINFTYDAIELIDENNK